MRNKVLFFGLLCLLSFISTAQMDRKVQAGIIQYIVQNMDWAEGKKQGNFNVYILGNDPIYDQLKLVLDGKVHKSQTIDVKVVESVNDLSGAHIIYFGESSNSDFAAVTEAAKRSNALLITSGPGMGAKGSGINFITKDGRQAYEINQKALKASDIRASSKLKSLGIAI